MIYILAGNDNKNKSKYIKTLTNKSEIIFIAQANISKELLDNYARSISLFGEQHIIVLENILNNPEIILSKEDLTALKDSATVFIFLEDKLLIASEKKYQKYATIKHFDEKSIKTLPTTNTFAITDAYEGKDKIKTWILYRQAIEAGAEPEAISGMLFWKIKMMILSNSKNFSIDSLKKQSSDIVSLYHKSHRGECDFIVGLEQFILKSLSSTTK